MSLTWIPILITAIYDIVSHDTPSHVWDIETCAHMFY